jgi:hypothetical protein
MVEDDVVICLDNKLELPPSNGTIRITPPTSISADTAAVVVKKQKTTGSSPGQSKRQIRVDDFDQLTKSLTEDCIAIYRAQIGAVQPFPVIKIIRPTICTLFNQHGWKYARFVTFKLTSMIRFSRQFVEWLYM